MRAKEKVLLLLNTEVWAIATYRALRLSLLLFLFLPSLSRPIDAEIQRPPECVKDEAGFSLALLAGDLRKPANVSHCFGTGKAYDGSPCQSHAAPSAWSTPEFYDSHISQDAIDTAVYYRDIGFGGLDEDPGQGVETASLAFYAGHGSAGGWAARKGRVWLDDLYLGNGPLRYLLACSCNVMAHGPPVQADEGGSADYRLPHEFQFDHTGTDADFSLMRNVFYRWRNAMSGDFRMACGGSSVICSSDGSDATEGFWNLYTDECAGPADAFTGGMGPRAAGSSGTTAIPLCIAKGGAAPTASPLYDSVFTATPNQYGTGYLHIQYPVVHTLSGSTSAVSPDYPLAKLGELLDGPTPPILPMFHLRRVSAPLLPETGIAELMGAEALELSQNANYWYRQSPDSLFWIHKASGAVHLRSKEKPSPVLLEASAPLVGVWTEVAQGLRAALAVDRLTLAPTEPYGLADTVAERFKLIEYRIDSTPVARRNDEVPFLSVRRYLKLIEMIFSRELRLEVLCQEAPDEARCIALRAAGLDALPVLGSGGKLSLVLSPKILESADPLAEVVLVSLIARPIEDAAEWAPVRKFSEAVGSAHDRLGEDAPHYQREPIWWRLGYLEEGAGCRQEVMRLYYWFEFTAKAGHSVEWHPPVTVRVPGQMGEYPEDPCQEEA